jgi:hypothetical protein
MAPFADSVVVNLRNHNTNGRQRRCCLYLGDEQFVAVVP